MGGGAGGGDCRGEEEGSSGAQEPGLAGGMSQRPRPAGLGERQQLTSPLSEFTIHACVLDPGLQVGARLGAQSLGNPHPKTVYTFAPCAAVRSDRIATPVSD